MKKTILTLALMTAVIGAHAAEQPAKPAAAINASAAHAGVASAPAAAAAPAAVTASPTVNVAGASTVAGAPLLLSLNGEKAIDPSFQQLFDAAQAHPKWKVTHVTAKGTVSRMSLKSESGKATIDMDAASSLVTGLKVEKNTVIEAETQSSGQGALVKFVKDKTPLGFMVNQSTSVVQTK
jgi:hypothetical protein